MISFLSPNFVTREIGGREVKFYPTRAKLASVLAAFIAPLADALTVLLAPNQSDIKKVRNESIDRKADTFDTTDVNEPVSVDLARYRDQSRSLALKNLIEGIAKPSSLETIAKLICDSLREEFESTKIGPKKEDVENVLDNLDIETAVIMAKALLEANEKAAGPLAPKLRGLADKVEAEAKTEKTATPG